jgi:hypothetical protein
MVVDAAKEVRLPKYHSLLTQVHGGDGVFESNDMANWIKNNPLNKNEIPPSFVKAYDAISTLLTWVGEIQDWKIGSQKWYPGLHIMDALEHSVGKGRRDRKDKYPRFGTLGLSMLSKITPDDPIWQKYRILDEPEQRPMRLMLINAAKDAIMPESQRYLFQAHHGDNIFESGDLMDWHKMYFPQRQKAKF